MTILKACPEYRRKALFLISLITLAGLALIRWGLPWLETYVHTLPLKDAIPFMLALLAVPFLSLVPFTIYFYRLGRKTLDSNLFPPPGTKVINDTVVLEGPAARRRGRIIVAISILLFTMAIFGSVYFPYQLNKASYKRLANTRVKCLTSKLILSLALMALPAPAIHASEPAPTGLEEVQTFRSEGRAHLDPGEKWDYGHYPPTSGPHDPVPVRPGFYCKHQAPEKLVHSLEHGNIVIYYEHPAEPVLRQLKTWAREYTGKWDGVIVTPLPGMGKGVILTAWTKLLRLDPFDPVRASAFMDAFRGKGPEHGQNQM